jgi:hypothetical protein
MHSYIHTYIHTHTHTHTGKMADDENRRVEDAFNSLVRISEKSGNVRKDLKNDILESVSTLRKIFLT